MSVRRGLSRAIGLCGVGVLMSCGGSAPETASPSTSTVPKSTPATTAPATSTTTTTATASTVAPTTSTSTTTTLAPIVTSAANVVGASPVTTTTLPPTTTTQPPTGDSCPGGDYSPSPNDGSCSAPTTIAAPATPTAPPAAPASVVADGAAACLNDTAAFDAASALVSQLATPPGGLSWEQWNTQRWTESFTVDPDGGYAISAWLPGLPLYDDRFQLAAIQCLADRTAMPAGVRSAINSPALIGNTQTADWPTRTANVRVHWTWDADSVLTVVFRQD